MPALIKRVADIKRFDSEQLFEAMHSHNMDTDAKEAIRKELIARGSIDEQGNWREVSRVKMHIKKPSRKPLAGTVGITPSKRTSKSNVERRKLKKARQQQLRNRLEYNKMHATKSAPKHPPRSKAEPSPNGLTLIEANAIMMSNEKNIGKACTLMCRTHKGGRNNVRKGTIVGLHLDRRGLYISFRIRIEGVNLQRFRRIWAKDLTIYD